MFPGQIGGVEPTSTSANRSRRNAVVDGGGVIES